MQEGKFDGVPDRLDLVREAADVGVGDVREFLQHQGLHVGQVDLLHAESGARIKRQHVAHPHLVLQQRVREADDALVVGPAHGHHPVVLEDLLDGDEFPRLLVPQAGDDHEGFVEQHFLPEVQLVEVQQRAHRDAQLAPALEDVHGLHAGGGDPDAGQRVAARVLFDDRAVAEGRVAVLFEAGLEVDDLLAGALQHGHQARVVGPGGGQLAVELAVLVAQHVQLPFGGRDLAL